MLHFCMGIPLGSASRHGHDKSSGRQHVWLSSRLLVLVVIVLSGIFAVGAKDVANAIVTNESKFLLLQVSEWFALLRGSNLHAYGSYLIGMRELL